MEQNHIVAQYRLPLSFNVVPKVTAGQGQRPPTTQRKRKRAQREPEDENSPDLEPPANRPRRNNANARPAPTFGDPVVPQAVPPREGSSSTLSSSPVPPPQPLRTAEPRTAPLNATMPPTQTSAPPTTDGETVPTLMEVNPAQGAITGGTKIWLKGLDFPALFPLFARFGTAVVPTVNPLACVWGSL
jgi:hypothetical protein